MSMAMPHIPVPDRAQLEAQGWAVVAMKEINVRTVSSTSRAAIVNWLIVGPGVMVTNHMSDYDIEQLWQKYRKVAGADVGPVKITTVESYQ